MTRFQNKTYRFKAKTENFRGVNNTSNKLYFKLIFKLCEFNFEAVKMRVFGYVHRLGFCCCLTITAYDPTLHNTVTVTWLVKYALSPLCEGTNATLSCLPDCTIYRSANFHLSGGSHFVFQNSYIGKFINVGLFIVLVALHWEDRVQTEPIHVGFEQSGSISKGSFINSRRSRAWSLLVSKR